MKEAAQRKQKTSRTPRVRASVPRPLNLSQPPQQLIIPQAARRFLHVRLQMIERVVVFVMAVPRKLSEISNQGLALRLNETRKLLAQFAGKGRIADEVT